MKKRTVLFRLLAIAMVLCCLVPHALAEETTEPAPYVIQDGPSVNNSLAFGSVCILNGCRTVDSFVPIGGADRRLETALAAFAYERSTGTLVYSYNPDIKVSPGGLAKMVTALVVIEHCLLDEVVTINSRSISRLPAGSVHVELKNEEQLTVGDLLHCMIMQGANDAAVALAEYVAGNQDAFVTIMNQRARQAGCTSTEFGNVHGLDNSSQYTTARDMAKIMLDASKNETFRTLLSTITYTVPETNRHAQRKFESQNYFIDAKNIQKFYDDRVKTGMQSYSPAAGANVIFTAQEKNMDMVFVVLGATRQFYENGWQVKAYGNFDEGQSLLRYVFGNFKANRVLYNGQALKQFAVSGGECNVVVEPHLDLDSVLPSDARMDNLIMEYKDRGLKAPINKDDIVATVEVWYRHTCLMEAELYAMESVRTTAGSGLKVLGGADRSDSDARLARYVLILVAMILIPVGGYLGFSALARARRRAVTRKRRGVKRRRYQA